MSLLNDMDLATQLQWHLDRMSLTIYGASLIIGAETDEPLKTIQSRLNRYTGRQKCPESLEQLEATLAALGLELVIVER